LAWKIELDPKAERDLSRLDRQVATRIARFLSQRVANLDDPRSIGDALQEPKLGGLWRYRVGDYRIVCNIQDQRLVILALRIAHRREVYRTQG